LRMRRLGREGRWEGEMNFTKLATGAALALGIALLSSPAAHADVILTYTGNDFTSVSGPYTTADRVTASINLAIPLADNLNLAPVTPLAFSLGDGVQTITNAPIRTDSSFAFTTDATGTIIDWRIDVRVVALPNDIVTTGGPAGQGIDEGIIDPVQVGSVFGDPGTWTTSASAVPAPPLSNLAAFGVLGLAFLWRRGRRIFGLGRVQ
jgi:MYXO-CTERM domain-containing protein